MALSLVPRLDQFLGVASWLPALAEAGSGARARIWLASRVTGVLRAD
jgi:hypothetical protein